MKHAIRNKIVDPVRGHLVKVETVNGDLGSGVFDANGKEIFEGDIVRHHDGNYPVEFERGCLTVRRIAIYHYKDGELEIIR